MLEIFAKLNAKRINQNGGSSKPLIEITDLCGVLASLSDIHSWYIYSMIEQRRSYNMELLHIYFEQVVLQEMIQRKFKSRKLSPVEFSKGVTKAAIYAHFQHKGKCGACNGVGRIGSTKCKKCDGKGSQDYTRTEKINYGFPMRHDLTRKWYQQSCEHYDQLIESHLLEIRDDLAKSLSKIKSQARQYRREENEELFDDD